MLSLAWVGSASPQAMKCPVCVGANVALQYTGDSCICATITGATGPAGPAGPQGPAGSLPASPCPVEGHTERWDGTAWQCYPTKFILGE